MSWGRAKCHLELHVACVKRSSTNTRRQLFRASLFSLVTSPEAGWDVTVARGLQGLSEAEEVEGGSDVFTRLCLFMITDMIYPFVVKYIVTEKSVFPAQPLSGYYHGLVSTEHLISHPPSPPSSDPLPRLSLSFLYLFVNNASHHLVDTCQSTFCSINTKSVSVNLYYPF